MNKFNPVISEIYLYIDRSLVVAASDTVQISGDSKYIHISSWCFLSPSEMFERKYLKALVHTVPFSNFSVPFFLQSSPKGQKTKWGTLNLLLLSFFGVTSLKMSGSLCET